MIFSKNQRLGTAGEVARTTEIWLRAARNAEKREPRWLSSWILFHAAELLAEKRSWPQADKFFEQAIIRADAAHAIKAQLLEALCHSFERRSGARHEASSCKEAVEESRKAGGETLATAGCQVYLARVLTFRGDLEHAEGNLKQALAIQEKLAPDSIAVADTFLRLGITATQSGHMAEAAELVKKALAIQQKLVPGGLPLSESLSRLAILKVDTGDMAEAEALFQQALAIQRELAPDSVPLATTLSGMGIAATNRGKLAEAAKLYGESLAIYQKVDPDGQTAGVVLSLMAQLDWSRGNKAKAEEKFLSAAKILKRTSPETRYYTYCLLGLGIIRYLDGDLNRSETYLREMLAIQLRNAPTHLFTADAYSHLGNIMLDRGELAKAEEYFLRALKIQKAQTSTGPRIAMSLDNLRVLAERRGDLVKADSYGTEALAIQQQIAPGSLLTAGLLSSLAGVKRQRHQPEIAAALYEQSLTALEKQMDQFGGTAERRSSFRADHSSSYFQYIDLLVQQQQVAKAIEVLERFRARSLLETMASARVDISNGVDPALVGRERALRTALNTKSESRIRLVGGTHTPEELKLLDAEISKLTSEHEEAEERLRDASPEYASLMRPQPLSAPQIQETLGDQDTLLEYALGKERSYVFAVTRRSVAAFELPPRDRVEKSARNFYKLLSVLDDDGNAGTRNAVQQKQAARKYEKAAAELSAMVLGPAAEELGKQQRVVVVADGALQFVPFTALPDPGKRHNETALNRAPLVVNHEVIDLPSASVLAELRRQAAARAEAPLSVAVLADPVFDKQDPRVAGNRRSHDAAAERHQAAEANLIKPESAALLLRSAADVGLTRNGRGVLPRLLFSRREADAILAAFPDSQGKALLDFDANRKAATGPELRQYRVIHFATHGLLDSEHPELSGLVLSLVDKNGNPQDGFLQLQDIYNMNLPADLVVLSACETALGKEIREEGMIGLTRGFMYAGASRVVASLWKVSDIATATLMAEFYRAMEKEGMPASAALRAAQIKMLKQKRWNDPYFWAAFQIQGEWR
jgi:CHAT domain-containing protein/Tfp pilus assembly protein PilF